jgi:hypothetical protein
MGHTDSILQKNSDWGVLFCYKGWRDSKRPQSGQETREETREGTRDERRQKTREDKGQETREGTRDKRQEKRSIGSIMMDG